MTIVSSYLPHHAFVLLLFCFAIVFTCFVIFCIFSLAAFFAIFETILCFSFLKKIVICDSNKNKFSLSLSLSLSFYTIFDRIDLVSFYITFKIRKAIYKYFHLCFRAINFIVFFYMSQKINSKNLPKIYSVKRRPDLPLVTVSLSDLCKIPIKKHIVGRYLKCFDSEKSRIIRIKMIAKDLTNLWKSLIFPIVSHQQVQSKIRSVIDLYKKYRKIKSEQVEKKLKGLFDLTKIDGNSLCSKDKKLYTTQIQTSGRVGYNTRKEADLNLIDSSKRKFIQSQPSTSGSHSTPLSCKINEENDVISDSIDNESDDHFKPVEEKFSKYSSAASAARLVSKHSLSTKKAAIVYKSLKEDGVDIVSPT